ncbi:CDC50/LEM3 family protein, partial [Kipferlia bialata]
NYGLGLYVFGAGLLALFVVQFLSSSGIQNISTEYGTVCGTDATCQVTLDVPTIGLRAPVYVYAQIDNMYQNHRRYNQSYSPEQIAGETSDLTVSDLEDECYPQIPCADEDDLSTCIDPCGIIYASKFEDSFTFTKEGETEPLSVSTSGIAWETDVSARYGDAFVAALGDEAEQIMNWMRVSGTSQTRKLLGVISTAVESGTYTVDIENSFDVASFEGTKSVGLYIVSGVSGGQNGVLSLVLLGTGALYVLIGYVVRNAVPGTLRDRKRERELQREASGKGKKM